MKLIFTTLLSLLPLNIHAFYLMTNVNAGFDGTEVKLYITSNSTCTNTGVSGSEILSMATEAADKFWNKVSTSRLTIKRGGTFTTTDSNYLTGELCTNDSVSSCNPTTSVPTATNIIIACNGNTADNFTSTNILALTAPNNVSNKKIEGSIILINDAVGSEFANLSRSEMINVLGHEIGHAIGLGHTNRNEALMYHKHFDTRYKLAQDDINGLTFLYPNQLHGCTGIFGTIDIPEDRRPPGNSNDRTSSKNSFLLSFLMGLSLIAIRFKLTPIRASKALKWAKNLLKRCKYLISKA